MNEKRTKNIQIRVTSAEHDKLRQLADMPHLGRWMREACLGTRKPQPQTTAKVVDTRLLRVLAGIGNNLNQLTRRANIEGIGDGEQLLLAIRRLEKLVGQVAGDR
jgi:hypothetical protein